MKKWSLILIFMAQNMTLPQAAHAASACLTVEPQCFVKNFANFKTFTAPGSGGVTFSTEPLKLIYAQRGNRTIFYPNDSMDRAKVDVAMSFIRSGAKAGKNLNATVDYLQSYLRSSSTNVTLEYLLTYTVFKQVDEIHLKKTGKFFSKFKDLALLFDKSPSEIDSVLKATIDGKGLVGSSVIDAFKPEPKPPVDTVKPSKPSEPIQSKPPVQPVAPTKPVTPTQPSQPVQQPQSNLPAKVPNVVEQDVIGRTNGYYEIEPPSSALESLNNSIVTSSLITSGGQITQVVADIRKALRDAKLQGLFADDYWDLGLEEQIRGGYVSDAFRFKSAISFALLRYATHVNVGRVVGSNADPSFRYGRREFKDLSGLAFAVNNGQISSYLRSLESTHPQYQKLKESLARVKAMKLSGRWMPIKINESSLVIGKSDSGIVALRQRLNDLGYSVSLGRSVYDEELESVLKNFNSLNSLPGKVSALTISKINVTADKRIQQIESNLERLRWLPVGAEDRYVFVNLGFSELKLYTGGQIKMAFRTVNGRLNETDDKKTPSQTQLIQHVLLNPTWTVPAGMAVRAKIPLIKKDPNWLTANNFKVTDGWTDKRMWDPITDRYITKRIANYVDADDVDWDDFKPSSNTPYWLVQQPGYNSTLGVLKFPLWEYGQPNKINPLDIYFHDTNERHLFANSRRLESSGCVRLQYPVEFAAELLQGHRGFTIEKIRNFLPTAESQASSEEYNNLQVDLPKAVTVHMLYLSADTGQNGELRFVEDEQAYKLDSKILAALKANH